ncbi:Hypothetical protein DEACI_4166 [Acididesulfobacillus acetoxydans]|uniref:Uncharacterized protein n=1 Tax=Acididesulfobacillus acetoxydans TaxID=1561005 RepID=A0A8S0VYT4_9FIRM|nr:Hypothetical protein DEACI_4166 [Acididesulfobacillus acetoxydans]CEJ09328.1 Hypothetical protein DEACI_3812 [Acididesulfobacillus acetoxydans]
MGEGKKTGECKLFCVNGIFAQTIFGLEYSWLLPIWEGRALLESNLSAQLVSAGGNGNCLFEVSLSNSISSRAEPRR